MAAEMAEGGADENASQRSDHEQLWLLGAEGRQRQDRVADVALHLRSPTLHSYAIPEAFSQQVQPGTLLQVPYGRGGRIIDAVCVRVGERQFQHTRRAIAAVVSPEPMLSPKLIELGLWISEYYACPPGLVLTSMTPAALRARPTRRVLFLEASAPPAEPLSKPAQQALLEALASGPQPRRPVLAATNVSPAALRTLIRKGLVRQFTREEVAADPDDAPAAPQPLGFIPGAEDQFELTAGQHDALAAISRRASSNDPFRVFLLFGVPGSGKTEVYVRAIRSVIERGRQALVLVPEIALATQVVQRLARRFARVAVWHSRLSPRVRRESARAIASGQIDVVIGTWSAVYAPCPQLGLIVVDEEQEPSFKALSAPFIHARDVAIKRAQLERACVVLGSATPSLETWFNVQHLPHFELLRLPDRAPGARVPVARLVHTRLSDLGQTSALLSPQLVDALGETLAAGQQAILLHNRRGYAHLVRCQRCGLAAICERCGAYQVLHRQSSLLKCHRCGSSRPAPRTCLDDTCGGPIEVVGLGIQKLEEELTRTVPRARLQRLDSDTMRRREDYAAALQAFEAGNADILLGTQMVAKGLDFPNVRLVGVIDADAALWLPDFRAPERTFQLITQVVGRAGRREGESLALVQSENPDVPAINHALRLDFEAFAAEELLVRREFLYPPYARLIRCVLFDERRARAEKAAERLAGDLERTAGRVSASIRVRSPQPCVIARLREWFRFEVLVHAPRDGSAQKLLQQASADKLLHPAVRRMTIDVDPVEMM